MNNDVYSRVISFKKRFPGTLAWRLKAHCRVVQKHLNEGEKVLYAFCAQKNDKWYDFITTRVIAITNKRMLIAGDRLLFGYFLTSITPDMFNDLEVNAGLIWGHVIIDTVKEVVYLSNISKKALDDIETNVTENIMREKKEYGLREREHFNS